MRQKREESSCESESARSSGAEGTAGFSFINYFMLNVSLLNGGVVVWLSVPLQSKDTFREDNLGRVWPWEDKFASVTLGAPSWRTNLNWRSGADGFSGWDF